MARRPVAVRLPEETIDGLDRLVEQGWYVTRTEGIEDALDKLLELFERTRIDEALVAGYERMPVTDDEREWAESSAREMSRGLAEDPEDW